MNRVHIDLRLVVAAIAALGITIGLAGVAGAEKPTTVYSGDLALSVNGGFVPRAVSRTRATPITFSVSANVSSLDGRQPPALDEFVLETDRSGTFNAAGHAACNPGIQHQRTYAEELCKDAIVGRGIANFEIVFGGSQPTQVAGRLVIFNGGSRDGVTTLRAYTYVAVPTQGAIVSTVKVRRMSQGRYGTRAVISVPKIAGGSGSVTSFNATIKGVSRYRGKSVSLVNLKCTDGHVLARSEAVFSDGTRAKAKVRRACTETA
jgi:hypothetical protein